MKPPDRMLREFVGQWVAKAEIDCRAAAQLLQAEDRVREAIAFHCQQAAEKFLKSFLVRHQVEFPKTHNLSQLLDLVASVDPDLSQALEHTRVLTPYGVDIRYPGDFPEILPGEEVELQGLALLVREEVLARLKEYLLAS